MGLLKTLSICLIFLSGCNGKTDLEQVIENNQVNQQTDSLDYRAEMRQFVIKISEHAKRIDPKFAIIPQNGIELISINGEATGKPSVAYLAAIDANGQESLFYGYNEDNKVSPAKAKEHTLNFLKVSQANGKTILVTDYCYSADKVADSYAKNKQEGFVSFAAPERDLNVIPNEEFPVFNENADDVISLRQAKNFLYLLNLANFSTKSAFINAIQSTNYDVILIDLFFNTGEEFTLEEITQLKTKANGGKRLVLSYMSIGEAEDYRYYWQEAWKIEKPVWLDKENPNWKGNFKVKYWEPSWQSIIVGTKEAYLDKILDAGFNGVYLDIIDGFEFFEYP